MPNANANQSTSPSEGGNVKETFANTTQTSALVVLTSNNKTNSSTNVSEEITRTCSSDTPGQQDRTRVIKKLGITSTCFIGPSCRPKPPSIEQELSDFYKELDEEDHCEVGRDAHHDQGHHPSSKPERDPQQKKEIPYDVTHRSRAYRPYQDPQEHGRQQWHAGGPMRLRPHPQYGYEGFGERQGSGPWNPPPWVPPGPPDFQYFPPPSFRDPMFPSHMRPWQGHADIRNGAQREGSWAPPDEWHDNGRRSFGNYRSSEETNWQQNNPEEQIHHYENTFHLVLLRGLPGSGKSSLARELMARGPNGTILSTDDYFFQDNTYVFDGTLLADAHDWNQKRALHAMSEGRSPVIIDNTNIKAWEMKPYVKMALQNGYNVDFCEPETDWKYDPVQLEKRNKHGVQRETIEKMLDRFERPVNIDIVMNSVEPPHRNR